MRDTEHKILQLFYWLSKVGGKFSVVSKLDIFFVKKVLLVL